ncbi:5-deoxy-glucuronate isomerase [Arhodomonas sp. AD133]|uniref:5-deoxy-glucuronate isomerase n=1 Tax=Arhodomonas sp. AD133 TaxID=3415009 RepID=UPI003EBCDE34
MPNLIARPHEREADGRVLAVTPESAGWQYVGFEVYELKAGETLERKTGSRELGVVMLTGRARAQTANEDWGEIGGRMDVFEQTPAYVLYVPDGDQVRLEAVTDVEVALCSAPGKGTHKPRLIRPEDVDTMNRGTGSMRRRIHNLLPDSEPADSLLLVEVYTPGGNWSSYPPHKHDTDRETEETQLEETYYHRLNPRQGFAFQRIYTDDRSLDEALAVEHGDCVMVPRGYHPVGAPAGYDLYYLNVMAGPKRQWLFQNDPDHAWLFEGIRSD